MIFNRKRLMRTADPREVTYRVVCDGRKTPPNPTAKWRKFVAVCIVLAVVATLVQVMN